MRPSQHSHPDWVSSTHQGSELPPPWKAPEPWDLGGSPPCASHILHAPFSLPRRLPNRVPSLRMLRSFFTDGVSGECVCVHARASGGWGVTGASAAEPSERGWSPPTPVSPPPPPCPIPLATWAPSSLKDTCTLPPQAVALAGPPSGTPLHSHMTPLVTFFRFSRTFLRC